MQIRPTPRDRAQQNSSNNVPYIRHSFGVILKPNRRQCLLWLYIITLLKLSDIKHCLIFVRIQEHFNQLTVLNTEAKLRQRDVAYSAAYSPALTTVTASFISYRVKHLDTVYFLQQTIRIV